MLGDRRRTLRPGRTAPMPLSEDEGEGLGSGRSSLAPHSEDDAESLEKSDLQVRLAMTKKVWALEGHRWRHRVRTMQNCWEGVIYR